MQNKLQTENDFLESLKRLIDNWNQNYLELRYTKEEFTKTVATLKRMEDKIDIIHKIILEKQE